MLVQKDSLLIKQCQLSMQTLQLTKEFRLSLGQLRFVNLLYQRLSCSVFFMILALIFQGVTHKMTYKLNTIVPSQSLSILPLFGGTIICIKVRATPQSEAGFEHCTALFLSFLMV